jgi:hypothetical protein
MLIATLFVHKWSCEQAVEYYMDENYMDTHRS